MRRIDLGGRWPVVVATALGAALVIWSWLAGVGAESIALEVGAGLVLVAVVYWLESRLQAAVSEQFSTVDRELKRLAKDKDSTPVQALVERASTSHEQLVGAFRDQRTLEAAQAVGERLKELQLQPGTNLYPHAETTYQVSIRDDGLLWVKVVPNGSRRRAQQREVTWQEGQSFVEFADVLLEAWRTSGLYPGDAEAASFDLVDELADVWWRERFAKFHGIDVPEEVAP